MQFRLSHVSWTGFSFLKTFGSSSRRTSLFLTEKVWDFTRVVCEPTDVYKCAPIVESHDSPEVFLEWLLSVVSLEAEREWKTSISLGQLKGCCCRWGRGYVLVSLFGQIKFSLFWHQWPWAMVTKKTSGEFQLSTMVENSSVASLKVSLHYLHSHFIWQMYYEYNL